MRLNYKRTIFVGFAFFLITAFWSAYDTMVPLILTVKFGMEQVYSGILMSLDNILAVFLLPIFGTLSDKTSTKFGKRTPYIVVGTIFSAIAFAFLGFINNMIVFILVLLVVLLFMASYRSPAVALMPDVTPKHLRSKGNAIINLMGTAGAILVMGIGILLNTSEKGKTDFRIDIIAISVLMLIALVIFVLFVKEKKWAQEMQSVSAQLEEAESAEPVNEKKALSKAEMCSLMLILASVALWYIGYNGVTSKYSVYATEVLNVPYTVTLIVAQAAAVVSYIPVGLIASKVGRKKCILLGVVMLTSAFGAASFVRPGSGIIMYALFALAGIGWATINVNSFPMVVELAKHGDTGKYTGFYYTASMSAQIVTPILSGFLIDNIGWHIFFPYAAIFTALAFITMLFVKHGDVIPGKVGKLEALSGADD